MAINYPRAIKGNSKWTLRRTKYGNKKVHADGYIFDSLLEAKRYDELKLLYLAKQITLPEVHPRYPIVVNGVPICYVELDFRYEDRDGNTHWEDTKGHDTSESRLKRKLIYACHGINVEILPKKPNRKLRAPV